MNFKKYIVPLSVIIIWSSIFGAFYFTLNVLGMNLEGFIFFVYDFMKSNVFMGASLFLIIFIFRPLLFIPVTPFELFAGTVFGVFWGVILCIIAYGFSTIFSHTVGRLTGGVFLNRLSQIKKIENFRYNIEKNTFSTIIIMRLLFFPVDLTNYLCGVLKVSRLQHVLGVMLGGIPGVFVFVLAGAAFYGQEINSLSQVSQNINYNYLFLASGLFLISIIISKILKKKYL